jgi:dihydrolipoamide dehydrogenase
VSNAPEAVDVIVIGAGPGGYPSAIRAAQLGLNTVCVEKEKLGGVCLNWGCIPSKALLKTAELAHKIRHADDFGLGTGPLEIDFSKVIGRAKKTSKRFERGVKGLFKKYGVRSVFGTARVSGPHTVEITAADGTTQSLTAPHIIIATGAHARTFPGIEPDGERILTYRDAIFLEERPPSVVVLGAGAIGMEFAYFLHAMGTEVTVLEGQGHVLPLEDEDMSVEVEKAFKKSGIEIRTNTFVDRVERRDDGCVVHLQDGSTIETHTVLAALGITPNSRDLGLEAAGVTLDRRGFIEVDASHKTRAAGIYAVGDVCSAGPALAHTATRQAHVAVERIKGLHVPDVDYSAMPSCTYCQPQVASVGMTERAAKEQGLKYSVGKFPFMANGRSQGAGTPDGFVKVIIGDQYGEILGAHIVGADATEMIAEFTLARASESTAELLMHTVHAHPTAAEAMLEAVAASQGASVHI